MHSVPAWYIQNWQYFKFVMFLSQPVEIHLSFYMKKEFFKNIDYFLRYFAIRKQFFSSFSYSSIIIFEKKVND